MIIGVNCGHTVSGTVGSGAVGYINESDETRKVGYELMQMLRDMGHMVVDCTDDNSPTTAENLKQICKIANAQSLDMFLSIHFNAGGGKGCEAYTFGGKDTAKADSILDSLSSLGFSSRGIKDGSGLYVVRNTSAPAVLVEVCFVDNQSDTALYKKLGAKKVAKAICAAVAGNTINSVSTPMVYNYVDENMPEWARATVTKLVNKGLLNGDENGLNLTDEMLRLLVINDRAGLYD